MKVAIGINKDLQNRFKRSNKVITAYLNHVNKQLAEINVKVPTKELLTNPISAIKKAYIEQNKHELRKFENETMLLDNFNFDFSYINKQFTAKNNEILSAYNQFGCDDNGLQEPDFNFYAETKEQIELFTELQAICDAINGFHLKYQRTLPTYIGLVPKVFQNFIETDISKLPLLKVNEYRLTQFQKV